MADDSLGVLFVCADNSARSIIAEVLLNRFGHGRFRAYSAGLEAAREIDPMTVAILASSGFDISGLHAKSWREFCPADAPRIDFVISFCDMPAAHVATALPGAPGFACWHISDPQWEPDQAARALAFRRALRELDNRVRLFALLRHPARIHSQEAPGAV